MPHWTTLTATTYDEAYYRQHRDAGLDYLHYDDWQRRYGRWLVDVFRLRGQPALDVGCACGALAAGLAESGAIMSAVDLSEAMIGLGRQKFRNVRLAVCDAVHLHPFADESFAFIHAHQTAEHWPPPLVPHILRELWRVTRPAGLFFCVLDTHELGQRQQRDLSAEDPTHICIRPWDWWLDQLSAAGWTLCTEDYRHPLLEHGWSYLEHHDWDWWVARR
jgi:SAM-dependent methyltransferase